MGLVLSRYQWALLEDITPKCVAIHLNTLIDDINMSPLEQIMTDVVKHLYAYFLACKLC
jgi:hypothetical protein